MRKKKSLYHEGDWFAVPLDGDDFAVGLVARNSRRGGVILGYFFGPRHSQLPIPETLTHLRTTDSLLVRHFSNIGLRDGSWPIILRAEDYPWNRDLWPMPLFVQVDPIDPSIAYVREYEEDNFLDYIQETKVDSWEVLDYPSDGFSGHIAMIRKLSHMLPKSL